MRRNFSFQPGEKSLWNRLYRRFIDGMLAWHHRLVEFCFSLASINVPRLLELIFSLARWFIIEVEMHSVQPEEYRSLTGGEIFRRAGDVRIGSPSAVARRRCPGKGSES